MLERSAHEDERLKIAMTVTINPPIARGQARRRGDSGPEARDPSPRILDVAVVLDDVDDLIGLNDEGFEVVMVGAG